VNQYIDQIDFKVHCISSTEGEISEFAQAFYMLNFENVRQEGDERGRNTLVFRVSHSKEIKVPVLRAGKLLWIYFVFKYLKEVHNLNGFIFSDWFANDSVEGEERGLGVAIVNFLLKSGGIDLQLSLPNVPSESEADLLSDWFAGWCNSSKTENVDPIIAQEFETLIERHGEKVDWIRYACNLNVM
jgi:hypothetical protein